MVCGVNCVSAARYGWFVPLDKLQFGYPNQSGIETDQNHWHPVLANWYPVVLVQLNQLDSAAGS